MRKQVMSCDQTIVCLYTCAHWYYYITVIYVHWN